jgi:hypothetical protein
MVRKHRIEIVLVVAIVLLGATYARWQFIPPFADRQVALSQEKYGFEVGEPGPWFSAWSIGDGQAYVMIGVDPSGQHLASQISEAGYRFARAGYGWATWAVSMGKDHLVPYVLAIVGGLAVLGVLAVAIRMRRKLGARSWLMVLNPALFIGFAGDTSEPMGILLLAIALGWNSWLSAALLGITRPSFLLASWGKWRLLVPGVVAAATLAIYSALSFGLDAMVPSGGRLGLPVVAYLEHLSGWGGILGLLAVGTVVVGLNRRDWSWVLSGLFVLCFGADVLRDPVNAWRAAGFLPVLLAFGTNHPAGHALRGGGVDVAEYV